MRFVKNKIFLFFLLGLGFLFPLNSFSQKLVAQVSKNKVVTGEVFQISFTVNGNMSGFKAPSFSDFDVYSGPNQSTSMQIANGSMSQTVSYSYMIAARKEGKLTIGSASANINGNKSESNPIAIEVAKGNPQQQQQHQQQQQNQNPFGGTFGNEEQQQDPQNISPEDLFIRTYVNKKQCYLGEQITVTEKIYARTNITHRGMQGGKFPSFDGFWSKAEEKKGNLPINTENLDGVSYGVVEFSQTYLFPQRTGKLTIDPLELDWVVRVKAKKQQSLFDQFFGGGGGQDVVAKLKSKPVIIDVLPLPEKGKPENYTGAVGNFTFSAKLNHDKVKANESINLKLTISGKGNISLASTPKINFPEGFETYDPKVNETISTAGGVSGTKTYEYLVIPRKAGEFILKDINFSYFDVDKKQYVTLPSPEIKITVEPADPNSSGSAQVYNPKHEIQTEENDIRYIKTGDLKLQAVDEEFFSSWKHFGLLGLITILFIGFMIGRNNYLKSQSDVVGVKQKRAIKIARKQLALAEKFKNENKQDAFYNEVLTALNSYVSFKLNIPIADLSKDNITENLIKRNVNPDTINKLISTLNDCEYARYAPAAAEKDLSLVYNNTIELITKIENELGKIQSSKFKVQSVALFILLFVSTQIFSINIQDSAATAYNHKEYKKAINYYEIILKDNFTSAALRYNLGNAYFKDNQLGKAIYNFELAKKLNPTDDDIKNNLRIANTKVVDKIESKENFFANTIKTGLYSLFSTTGWAYATIICLLVAALLFILFSITDNAMLKRLGFWAGSLFVIGFLLSLIIGYAALRELNKNTQAIIISQETSFLAEPNATAKAKFNLHEGTKVNVLSINADYTAIQLANGNEGFIATKDLGLF